MYHNTVQHVVSKWSTIEGIQVGAWVEEKMTEQKSIVSIIIIIVTPYLSGEFTFCLSGDRPALNPSQCLFNQIPYGPHQSDLPSRRTRSAAVCRIKTTMASPGGRIAINSVIIRDSLKTISPDSQKGGTESYFRLQCFDWLHKRHDDWPGGCFHLADALSKATYSG